MSQGQSTRSNVSTSIWLIEASYIRYYVKLGQNLTSSFQVTGNFHYSLEVDVKCNRNTDHF